MEEQQIIEQGPKKSNYSYLEHIDKFPLGTYYRDRDYIYFVDMIKYNECGGQSDAYLEGQRITLDEETAHNQHGILCGYTREGWHYTDKADWDNAMQQVKARFNKVSRIQRRKSQLHQIIQQGNTIDSLDHCFKMFQEGREEIYAAYYYSDLNEFGKFRTYHFTNYVHDENYPMFDVHENHYCLDINRDYRMEERFVMVRQGTKQGPDHFQNAPHKMNGATPFSIISHHKQSGVYHIIKDMYDKLNDMSGD